MCTVHLSTMRKSLRDPHTPNQNVLMSILKAFPFSTSDVGNWHSQNSLEETKCFRYRSQRDHGSLHMTFTTQIVLGGFGIGPSKLISW